MSAMNYVLGMTMYAVFNNHGIRMSLCALRQPTELFDLAWFAPKTGPRIKYVLLYPGYQNNYVFLLLVMVSFFPMKLAPTT